MIIQKIVLLLQENLELCKLRDWLLPMFMNGQVTVRDDKIIQGDFDQNNRKTYEVKQAARTFGNKNEADDTKDLLQEYLEYKRNGKGTKD